MSSGKRDEQGWVAMSQQGSGHYPLFPTTPREKVWSQNRARLADAGENHSCPSTPATGSRVCF